MEIYRQALEIAKSRNIRQLSNEELSKQRCEELNKVKGNLNESDGYNCTECLNRGYIHIPTQYGTETSVSCSKCAKIRNTLRLLNDSGIIQYRFEDFAVECEWEKVLLDTVLSFTVHGGDKWLFVGGQSGAGKTHLCSAALINLVHRQQKEAMLFAWIEKSKKLKRFSDDDNNEREIEAFKTVPLLYIDDLFKTRGSTGITEADINLALDIIDYRYRNNLTTIISTEMSIDEIISISEALGGRIKQKSKEYTVYISKDIRKNKRLRD